ncbi:hypothetical protein BDQ12DRAFT_689355 [Crucibulum laeve]|uniref:DUF6534 domain-containing protein n=1 Tax=Crucibulum laeve TaxID=68775 RepID=A0A5C3LQR9_9AGAR|nr:hypothetical protein BDQ12DRAFT_689355 [Crucibulum laeve]
MSAIPGVMPPAFDNTLGSLLVGGLVAMALWGVTCVQTYTYFSRGSRDPPAFKALIGFLLVLDTFDSALNAHILYHYMVSNYLNPLALLLPVWSVIIHVAITSISNFMIRTMFAQRVYKLSNGNILVTLWIMALSATDLVVGIIITAKAFQITSFLELSTLSSLMYTNFAAGTGSDLSVALALCFLLYRSRTGFRKTDTLIGVLMAFTINTGLIVAVDAALGLIMYIVMPNNFIFLGFYLLLSKLYLNSYLATLNAREELREKIDEPVSIHLSQVTEFRRYDVESSMPSTTEKTSRSDTLAGSIQTFVDKKVSQSSPTNPSELYPGRAY